MATYLLAWNPKRSHWSDLGEYVSAFNRGEVSTNRWSCGRNKKIVTGDRIWLIRLGENPRGIFANGTVTTPSYEDVRWDDPSKTSQYVRYQIDSIVNPLTDRIIPRVRLNDFPFSEMRWDTQISGIRIPDHVAVALQQEWSQLVDVDAFCHPDEVASSFAYFEGALRIITVNSYERNSSARTACIAHYRARCVVCSLNFTERYGQVGNGLIHVHHLVPLATIGKSYKLNPIEDLRPVCPNCHAIIHRRVPHYTIEDVKQMIGA
jgi:5-methylcytosine-specific restriction protein A